jgi:hypothetical protein
VVLFLLCVDVVGTKGWGKDTWVKDKMRQPLKVKYLGRIVFLFFGVKMAFYYGCITGKNAQDAKF